MESSQGSNVAKICCRTPSLYSRLVLLHKAKCGRPFKVLGTAFAVAMAWIYLSGVLIAWQASAGRRTFLATLLCGTAVTTLLVLLSM